VTRVSDVHRAWAGLRVLALAILFIAAIIGDRARLDRPGFWYALACSAAWTAVAAILSTRHRALPDWVLASVDLAVLCLLIFLSGGAYAQARKAFFVVPVMAALFGRPRTTAIWAGLATAAYVATVAAHPDTEGPNGLEVISSHALYLLLVGGAAVVVSGLAARRLVFEQELIASLRALNNQAAVAEQETRRELAYALHDHAVQNLLAAARDVRRAESGDAESAERIRTMLRGTVDQLRGTIADLHPYTLDHAGLRAALEQLAAGSAERSGVPVYVAVEPGAEGHHDVLLFNALRELLRNAERHARADHIHLSVAVLGRELVARAHDDGHGLPPGGPPEEVRRGHIGLASVRERVQAAGGRFSISSAQPGGTIAELRLPLNDRGPARMPARRLREERTTSADGV
jgi:two-component system, NarL family, sensor kinase